MASAHEWDSLTDAQQLRVSNAALLFAVKTIAGQAEMLAVEMDAGTLMDCGGPDALRLLAAILRISSTSTPSAASIGHYNLATSPVAGCA